MDWRQRMIEALALGLRARGELDAGRHEAVPRRAARSTGAAGVSDEDEGAEHRADIALAKTGIEALVDEATGFQAVRGRHELRERHEVHKAAEEDCGCRSMDDRPCRHGNVNGRRVRREGKTPIKVKRG